MFIIPPLKQYTLYIYLFNIYLMFFFNVVGYLIMIRNMRDL